jgi:transposase-like protein/Zn ribbon nucleic-acid-binding protein
MSYILKEFNAQFPDDRACLDFMFKVRFPRGSTCPECQKKDSFHPLENRRAYNCQWCGHHFYPTAGTIFHKSPTSLQSWFFAIFLMSASKNGVAAKELQRQLGVTYKTAWRMAHQIRKLMADGKPAKLMGIVEADETYMGGVRKGGKRGRGAEGKTPVIGIVERDGRVIAKVVDRVTTNNVFTNISRNVDRSAALYSDELAVYRYAPRFGYKHRKVNHGRKEYVRGDVHTNTIEGFWSQLKRSVNGTHHSVSAKHLQKYVDEFSFRYNHRKADAIFPILSARLGEQLSAAA